MKRVVDVKPFGFYKITDEALRDLEASTDKKSVSRAVNKKFINKLKNESNRQLIVINPSNKEVFSMIPIIEDGNMFGAQFPNPIQMYFSLAYANYEFYLQTRENIIRQKNGQAGVFHIVNQYLYNWHLKYKILVIIFLHSTVESFINFITPDEFIYKQSVSGGENKKFLNQVAEYNKSQTEKWISYKEKITELFEQLKGINLRTLHKDIYDNLLKIHDLRNDLIHLKSTKIENSNYFHSSFDKIINIDLKPLIDSVENFLNMIEPNFINYTEVSDTNEAIKFKFESYGAFSANISIFMQILEARSTKIDLEIPISDEKNYDFVLSWILDNLNIMAEKQIIFIPEIIKSESQIIVKITKIKGLSNIE